MMTQHTEDHMMVIMEDALIKPKQIIAVWISAQSTSFLGFFERKRYQLHMQYVADNEVQYEYHNDHPTHEAARKDMKSVIEQLRGQIGDDQFASAALEEALTKAGQ